MNTCEEHDGAVVVYTGRKCPVCDALKEQESIINVQEDKIAEVEHDRDRVESLLEEVERIAPAYTTIARLVGESEC